VKFSQALSLTISNSSPALSGRALLWRVAILKPRQAQLLAVAVFHLGMALDAQALGVPGAA
jgi:hypothetical protein